MAESQHEIYTIFCLIVDDDSSFSVEIAKGETVGQLKKMINEKKHKTLANIEARKLKLYHFEFADDNQLVENVKEKWPARPRPLDAWDELANIFKDTPKKATIHIIVESPESVSMTPTNNPTRLPEQNRLTQTVGYFETRLRVSINEYLRRDPQLPLWQPQSGTDTARSHIIGLRIPSLLVAANFPSLLLHNLGQPSHDPHLIERVAKLFDSGIFPKFLWNASGTGKTRLLFEGIWYRWSLYVTARSQPDGVGSSDLEEILRDLEGELTIVTEENRAVVLAANQEQARRCFLRILYARMLIFRVFLECASKMPGGITEEHKGRWLLMQVAPKTLTLSWDPFSSLVRLFSMASVGYLKTSIETERLSINKLLGPNPPALFCVLDESQVPATLFFDHFLSETNPAQRQPILHEIILSWRSIIPNIIVSGTGIFIQPWETAPGVVAKEVGPKSETITDIGAFDNAKGQRAYLEACLPPGYLDTEAGKVVESRVRYWLHGRHRFTATYISRLLQSGLESPHRVLNEFVHDMTNFRPSDHKDDLPVSTELGKPYGFSFSKLKADKGLCRQIAGIVFDYIFNGKPRAVGGPDCEKLVENGFARFGTLQKVVADEPLALLAAIHYFTSEDAWSLPYFLVDGLSTADESAGGIAFEHLTAYLLALAFKAPMRLSNVFEFFGDSDLKDEIAHLVAIHKTEDGVVSTAVDIDSGAVPTYILGRTCCSVEETLSWLQNPRRTVFCFPPATVGLDLILTLRLSDGRFLRVLVQSTQKAEKCVDPSATEDLQGALGVLGLGTDEAGDSGVLRVLVPHPAIPTKHTLTDLANAETSLHPVATVDLASLHSVGQQILMSLQQGMMAAAQERKRKPEEDIEGFH